MTPQASKSFHAEIEKVKVAPSTRYRWFKTFRMKGAENLT